VELDESVECAAVREAREETGLEVQLAALLGVYSQPGRDPRGPTASVVYVGSATGEPRAMDDAQSLRVVRLVELPAALAFDHARILAEYRRYRELGELPVPSCARR
jgi:8-oxo-dGTP diphosphatase